MEAKTEVNRDRVIAELAKIAFLAPRKVLEEDGTLKPLSAIDDDTAAALAGLDVTETKGKGVTKAIKISDKRGALETLCKILGYFAPEKHLVRTQDVGNAEIIFE